MQARRRISRRANRNARFGRGENKMVKSQKIQSKSSKTAVSRTLRIVRIAVFVALIIVGAFVKFPIGIVPVSMQFAFCMFASLMLGGLDSFACVAIYIVMGLIGIPVFSAGGGFAYVLQPTFGYILGFLIAAPVGGFVARGSQSCMRWACFICILCSTITSALRCLCLKRGWQVAPCFCPPIAVGAWSARS